MFSFINIIQGYDLLKSGDCKLVKFVMLPLGYIQKNFFNKLKYLIINVIIFSGSIMIPVHWYIIYNISQINERYFINRKKYLYPWIGFTLVLWIISLCNTAYLLLFYFVLKGRA